MLICQIDNLTESNNKLYDIMLRYKRWIVLWLLFVLALGGVFADTVKREFRSVWIATVANIDWPSIKGNSASIIASQKEELVTYIENMERMNLTTICFQVRSMCDAMYKSSYEPWSSYLTGTRGADPGWDPLAFMVDECHKRGIEVYAWVNPYRWSSTGSTSTWDTDFDTQVKNAGWLMTNDKFTVLNPGLDETREHIVNVCREIITNYSVEGLIFDDYFYPSGGTTETSSAPDYSLWQNSGTNLSIGDWRRENVDKMVRDVYNMVQDVRPEVRFGIAPPGTAGESAEKYGLTIWPNGYDGQYYKLYSDPLSWMDKGIVDFVSPQVYWHNDHPIAPFGVISNWWYSLAKHFNRHCSISMNIYDMYENDDNTQSHWDEHVENVLQSRTYAADNGVDDFGSNLYSIKYLYGPACSGHGEYLREKCFQTKCLVPVVDWKETPVYGAVDNLVNSDGTLSWSAVTDGLSTIRYTVYAIPDAVEQSSVVTVDGIDGMYLLGVTYGAEYSLPADKKSDYWYAVCVYDGYGKEHTAAIVDYPEGNYTEKAVLIAPEDNAEVKEEITFNWKTTDNNVSEYTLQVSSTADFSSIKYSREVERSTSGSESVTVSASQIGIGRYYWRVVSSGNGYFDTPSDVREFNVTDVGVGGYEEGYMVMTDGSVYGAVGSIHAESMWMRSVKEGYGNMSFPDGDGVGSWNRGMVASGDYVYLSGRLSNSASATAYIEKYNGITGEYMGRITLGSDASVGYYPCNNIVKDSKGNVCISNLTMTQSYPLVIHRVDIGTGEVTRVAEISSEKQPQGRFDHVSIIGDVMSGNFTVFGVATNTSNILKWKFSNGECSESMVSVSEYYPTSAGSFGLAPRVVPVSEDDVFVDGSNTAITRYDLSNGSRSDSFLANLPLAPKSVLNNGGVFFPLGDRMLMVYANGDDTTSPANTFNVVATDSDFTFSGMSQLWELPENGLGTVNSVTYQAAVDYVVTDSGYVRLYMYIPGNGLCAYEIYDSEVSGMDSYEVMVLPESPTEYYNLQGMRVSGENLMPGIYIIKQGATVKKILVK